MKICVIGGSGFVGSSLVRLLVGQGHKVTIFDKRQSRFFNELVSLGDVRDFKNVNKVLNGCETIYNLAAEHSDNVRPISLYYDVNVGGARNIADACRRHGIKKCIFTSSVAVYGLKKKNPHENSLLAPFNHYGKSKVEAENIFKAWADEDKDRTLSIIRPCVIFGEGNRGNVYNLIKQVQSGNFLMVGKGTNKKSMAYIANVAQFIVKILDLQHGIHTFNYSDKPDLSTNELVSFIHTRLGRTAPLRRIPYILGLAGGMGFDLISRFTGRMYPISTVRIQKFCADTTIAIDALKKIEFRPPFTIEEGLQRMIDNIDQEIYFEGGG